MMDAVKQSAFACAPWISWTRFRSPCLVVVDDALKSSIVEAAESLAVESLAASATTPTPTLDRDWDDDDEDVASRCQVPAGFALAALVFGCSLIWI